MTAAIIQARMGSSRLPGKTLMMIEGETLLGHLVKRVRAVRNIDEIIIATTTEKRDNVIAEFAKNNNLKFYRGSEKDVLDRFYKTAVENEVETIVRVTPDCPVLDPRVTDLVVSKYVKGAYDYVSNVISPTYPDGLDTEVFSFQALEKTWKEAVLPSEREHATSFIIKHPELFRIHNVRRDGEDLSWMRWTVDTEQDLNFVKKVYEKLYRPGEVFYMKEVVALINEFPELLEINKRRSGNQGYMNSRLKVREV